MALPAVIQGGMGIGVSHWKLARAVSLCGQLGVVSGTAADTLLVRRLQDGDSGGHLRRALAAFPNQEVAQSIVEKFFKPLGREPGEPYKLLSLYTKATQHSREWISVAGAFAEVFLAKEGHSGSIGMNLLTKIQLPTITSLYGALLAKVDYLLVGAGIPREIPEVLTRLLSHEKATMRLDIAGKSAQDESFSFNPSEFLPAIPTGLVRPKFLPIVSSHSLATMLEKKLKDGVDGFIVEGAIAGGHNAPPREKGLTESGEPLYGPKDEADLSKLRELGKPFWLAGGTASHEALELAHSQGAAGVQVGTLFALCAESGMLPSIRQTLINKALNGGVTVFTDPKASPTGFPFKVVQVEGSASELEVYESRPRICDVGLLREAYHKPDGTVGLRCSAAPLSEYEKKGGAIEECDGRKCVCNGLLATVGLGQTHKDGYEEPILVTAGNDFSQVRVLAERLGGEYTAADAVDYILRG